MEGTSLDEAYGVYSPVEQQQYQQPQQQRRSTPIGDLQNTTHQQQMHDNHPQARQQSPSNQLVLVQQSPQPPPQPKQIMHIPSSVMMQPHMQSVAQHYPQRETIAKSTSYIDAMASKRRDVLRMVAFAVIILLAISIHYVVDFGMKELIMSNDFTFKQELGVRIIYPLIVIFFMWNMKAMTSGR